MEPAWRQQQRVRRHTNGCAGSTGHACMNSRRHTAELRSLLYNTAICKQCVPACKVHRQWLGIRTLCGVWGKASHLGIIPPAMIPSATSSRTCRISRDTNFVATSSLSLSTPGTSVMRISFSAFNEAAICMCNELRPFRLAREFSRPGSGLSLACFTSQGFWPRCCTGRRRCMAYLRGLRHDCCTSRGRCMICAEGLWH